MLPAPCQGVFCSSGPIRRIHYNDHYYYCCCCGCGYCCCYYYYCCCCCCYHHHHHYYYYAAAVFWYKPNSSHKHLYPALKNEAGEPTKELVDGEEQYAVDPAGIEIFKTMCTFT